MQFYKENYVDNVEIYIKLLKLVLKCGAIDYEARLA